MEALDAIEAQLAELRREELAAAQERAALAARVEALHVGLNRKDASRRCWRPPTGRRAARLRRRAGQRASRRTRRRSPPPSARRPTRWPWPVSTRRWGRSTISRPRTWAGPACCSAGAEPSERADRLAALPDGARTPSTWSTYPTSCRGGAAGAAQGRRGRADLPAAQTLVARLPDLVAVTRDGDVLSAHFAAGGSSAQPSLIEVQAAIDDAEQRLTEASHACDRLRFAQSQLEEQQRAASAAVEVTLARLHESDAAMAALAEELGQLSSTARSATSEAERLRQAIAERRAGAGPGRRRARRPGAPAGARAETEDEVEPDPAERDRLAEQARLARGAEMDARLALRTLEERARALAGRADALRRAAEARTAGPGHGAWPGARGWRREARPRLPCTPAATFLARLRRALPRPGGARAGRGGGGADRSRGRTGRGAGRGALAGADFESLVDAAHRDEMARAEQRMRVEALTEKAMAELGLGSRSADGRLRAGPAGAGAHSGGRHRHAARTSSPSRCRTSASSSRSGCGPPSVTSACSAGSTRWRWRSSTPWRSGTSSSPSSSKTCGGPARTCWTSSPRSTAGASRSSPRRTRTSSRRSSGCSPGCSPAARAGWC